jgi:hypothetical protein
MTRPPGRDRGMVTAEMAFAALALAAFLYLVIGCFGVVFAQLRCTDAAAEITRQAARGDEAAIAAIQARLPGDATVTRADDGEHVRVHVELTVRPWGRYLVAVTVTADAATRWET